MNFFHRPSPTNNEATTPAAAPQPNPSVEMPNPAQAPSVAPQPNPMSATMSQPSVAPTSPSVTPQPNPMSAAPVPPVAPRPVAPTPSAPTAPLGPTSGNTSVEIDYVNDPSVKTYEAENVGFINDVNFSDVYIPFDKKTFIWGAKTNCGLKLVRFADFNEFFTELEKAFDGNRSYLLNYKGRNYRVERTIALDGPQYCARKMPITVPNIRNLGLPQGVYEHLISLADGCGLILLAGATGSGKSTTVSALLKEFLQLKGGYAYTIEDPIEMPLDGVYKTPIGELGLCKQTTPPDGIWEEGIKSALRSKPRYVYLGEIRSPDIASEALRAATSGHLVISTIHANNVPDAVNSLVKYAASSGISEEMAFELVANGFLGCLHQVLEGAPKRARVTYLFANPNVDEACQVRGMIRSGKLNLATLLEQQRIKIEKKMPLF